MGVITNIRDRLTNVMSGMGTTADRRTSAFYAFQALSPEQAEAAYRTSWLVRKIVDIPPFDMTREWRDWQAEGSDIETIEKEEKRLQLRAKCQRALVLARLYGGGALLLGTKNTDPMQPLDPERVGKEGLVYIHVLSRQQLTEGEMVTDPADPWFGHPTHFTLNATNRQPVSIHPSRIIAFIGQKAPEGCYHQGTSWFWGDPIMQSIGDAVKDADLARSGFAALIDEAKIDILKIPGMMANVGTAEYEARLLARLGAAAAGKSTWRALMIDGEEEWEQRQVNWSGMPEVISAYLNIVAGAADIPVTRLLGQSPKGLQSNGDGEKQDYQDMVKARQEEMLAPALDRIDDLLIRSALGSRPTDVYYEFAPLSQMSEKDAAEVESKYASSVKTLADTGLIPQDALAKAAANRMIESGQWPGLEAAIEESDRDLGEPPEGDEDDLLTEEERVAKAKGEQGGRPKATVPFGDAKRRKGAPTGRRIKSFDPNQPRGGDGRWISTGARYAKEAISSGAKLPGQPLGPPSKAVRKRLEALGIRSDARSVALDSDMVRHINKRHAKDSRGQKPINLMDFGRARVILNKATINRGTPQQTATGARIHAAATIGSDSYDAAYEVRKYRIVLVSLRKR